MRLLCLFLAIMATACASNPTRKTASVENCHADSTYVTLAEWAAATNQKITVIYFPGDEEAVRGYVKNNGAAHVATYLKEDCSNRDTLSQLESCDRMSDGSVAIFYHFKAPPLECE